MARPIKSTATCGTPGLPGKHAQQMQGLGMIGLLGQDLPVDRLGRGKPAGLVMLHRQIDRLLDGHRVIFSPFAWHTTSATSHDKPLPRRGQTPAHPSAGNFACAAAGVARSSRQARQIAGQVR